jgi:putative membrane protein
MDIRTPSNTVARAATLGLLLAAAGTLHAQIGNPGGAAPTQPTAQPGPPPQHQANNTDRLFVLLVGAGGLGEVEAGRLADTRAASPAVKQFAQRMVQDHGRANARLADFARRAGVTVPSEPGTDEKAMQNQLQALRGRSFDVAYLKGQLVDHQKTVQLLEWEIGQGQHVELQRYAMETLPTVVEHLGLVQSLLAEATGAPPSGLAQSARFAPH